MRPAHTGTEDGRRAPGVRARHRFYSCVTLSGETLTGACLHAECMLAGRQRQGADRRPAQDTEAQGVVAAAISLL